MKNSKKSIALIIAGLILVSSFSSCAKKDNDKAQNSNNDENEVEDVTELKVPKGIADGKTFSMYFAMPSVQTSYIAKEENGEPVNDAVYQRNQLVEEHTGVELEFVASTRSTHGTDQDLENELIRTLIQSGDTTYDAFIHSQRTAMFTLVEEGMFVNWYDIPHIDLENEWWYSNVIRDISFGDKVYAMTGDYNLNSFSETECLLFNKTLCDELELAYPYQMVLDGNWTHEKFVEYIRAATKDLNGDGKIEREYDRYGFGGWKYEQLKALFAGYGGASLIKDDDNMPVLNVDNELTYTVVDKILEVFDCDGSFYEGSTFGADDKMFKEGRLLFNDSFLKNVVESRSIEEYDIGFIPYPKLDKNQKDYYSRTADISGLTFIPVTNQDLDKTGAVLEALAYYSKDTIMPVYFDTLLTIKSTRDVESEMMIPIIRGSSRFMDCIINFDGSAIVQSGKGNTLSSTIASNADAWQIKVDNLIEFYSAD